MCGQIGPHGAAPLAPLAENYEAEQALLMAKTQSVASMPDSTSRAVTPHHEPGASSDEAAAAIMVA